MEESIKELEEISALFEAKPIKLSLVDFAAQTFALIDGVILGGGLLMSVYARPRLTMDLDLIIIAHNDAQKTLLKNGYINQDHLHYSKPEREIIKLAKNSREVDLIFFKDSTVENFLISTSTTRHLFGKDIKILGLEGFLLTKIISWRLKDQADIKSVMEHQSKIDMDTLMDLTMYLKIFDRISIFDKE